MQVTREEYKLMAREVAQNAANISIILNQSQKILSYIENDESTGRRGLFAMQQEHEKRLDQMDLEKTQEKTKQKIYVGIATFVGGLVMSLGTLLFKLIFGK